MPKWRVESVPDVVEGLVRHYITDGEYKFQIAQGTAVANQLSSLLNTLEEQNAEMQEARRWRKIGEEWPEPGQACELRTSKARNPYVNWVYGDDGLWHKPFSAGIFRVCGRTGQALICIGGREDAGDVYVHWRPAPVDVPKEEDKC